MSIGNISKIEVVGGNSAGTYTGGFDTDSENRQHLEFLAKKLVEPNSSGGRTFRLDDGVVVREFDRENIESVTITFENV